MHVLLAAKRAVSSCRYLHEWLHPGKDCAISQYHLCINLRCSDASVVAISYKYVDLPRLLRSLVGSCFALSQATVADSVLTSPADARKSSKARKPSP